MRMVFLEMAQSKVFAGIRFFSLPCLLLRQSLPNVESPRTICSSHPHVRQRFHLPNVESPRTIVRGNSTLSRDSIYLAWKWELQIIRGDSTLARDLMRMVFLEMAQSKVFADIRFFSLPCLLLRQFEKTFTPQNLKFEGEIDQNLLIFATFW